MAAVDLEFALGRLPHGLAARGDALDVQCPERR